MKFHAVVLTSLISAIGTHAADPFAEGVRPTDPLTPEQQQKTFKLPPGFEIQLVAAEPDLRKPMNMAFDNKGRLWITDSREYPFAAPLDKPGRDAIKIFEDFDETGRARKITTFVDGLNIPTGLYPYKNGVIAWSIPNIWYFQDTDGDGKADKREILFGPLGWERDTHGMDSSFRRNFDGWLYMTHGFNNNTVIRGRDGSELKMNSGNTYRVRVDGSRVEQHTWGQVNPFGLAIDPLGNIYSADCHSAPVYELLRGGYYPSFGKPHDGLGFAPTMIEHSHGSTAIAGIQFYSDNLWPEEFQNNTFIGNVMTSRVNRDSLREEGSSKRAKEEPDFVATTDPWFRPVDLQFGPDGAMYIADFYNRIIGHYEVPLMHPGRDRERGRLWRVVYKGQMHPKFDVSKASPAEMIKEFGSPNQTRRMIAMNETVDRLGNEVVPVFQRELRGNSANAQQRVHMLWVLHRLEVLPKELLAAAARHGDRLVRTHAMRILSETKRWSAHERELALVGLKDKEAIVQRSAADALAQYPAREHVKPLIAMRPSIPAADDHLVHTIRMAMRNQLIPAENLNAFSPAKITPDEAAAIADVALGIHTPAAGAFLLDYIKKVQPNRETTISYIRHISRYVDAERVPSLAELVQHQYWNEIDQQLVLYKSLQEGAAQRGMNLPPAAVAWGADLAEQLLNQAGDQSTGWRNLPVENVPSSANPWFVQERDYADGKNGSKFLCSLPPGGEQLTGRLRSPEFSIPQRLTFFLAGHDGFPEQAAQKKNFVRLVEAESGKVLTQAYPPRNDVAQKVEWNLQEHTGKKGWIELVDGDTGTAYAWLAAGRFEPNVVTVPAFSPNESTKRQIAAAELTQSLGLKKLAPKLGELVQNEDFEPDARAAIGRALVNLAPNENRLALAPLISDVTLPPGLRSKIAKNLASSDDTESLLLLTDAMRSAPLRVQTRLAQSLAGNQTGALTLLHLVEQSQASPQVLRDKGVQDKLFAISENNVATRAKKAVDALPAGNAEIQAKIDKARSSYLAKPGQAIDGGKVFTATCAACHQVDGAGSLVGPQLDGIGNRGLERVIEDILDPNRNVDHAFRTHIITLKDGDVVSGLPRREEGEVMVLADSSGKEIKVPLKEIEKRRESESSLMPENFGEVLNEKDLKDLLAFLLSRGTPRQ